MKAYIIHKINEYPVKIMCPFPGLKENEVYLKLNASSLNHRDIWIVKGQYPDIRMGSIMGSDGCGTSDGVTYIINPGLHWGDDQVFQSKEFKVLGVPDDGTFAEHIAINKKYLYPRPGHLTDEEAAALPLAGVTAFRAIIKRAQIRSSDTVLISGIGGGVALFSLQFALSLGCIVLVTSSSDLKLAEAISLGASAGYIYSDPEWDKKLISDFGGVDVIIDGACGDGFNRLLKICNPGARISIYGGSRGRINTLSPQILFWRQITILGSTMGSDSDFEEMVAFVDQYKIKPVIDSIIPFEDIPSGFRRMESGNQFGKIVFRH